MLYDTHSHPYLAKDLSETEILESFFSWGWKYINSIWCDIESSKKSIELSNTYPWVYASIGIHPTHVLDYLHQEIDDVIGTLESLYLDNKDFIVAIWETGLDYYWLKNLSLTHKISTHEIVEIQKNYFRAQIRLADKLWLPIIIHNRESSEDIYKILQEEDFTNFVFHCFSEDLEYAQKLIKFAPNCMIWLWWVVTFKNAVSTQRVAENIDLKHIIIETDSPYLTPTPFRWKRENEPILVKEVLSKIIDLRSESSELITQQIFQNSIDFFSVKK